jgi:hypothetical protein
MEPVFVVEREENGEKLSFRVLNKVHDDEQMELAIVIGRALEAMVKKINVDDKMVQQKEIEYAEVERSDAEDVVAAEIRGIFADVRLQDLSRQEQQQFIAELLAVVRRFRDGR